MQYTIKRKHFGSNIDYFVLNLRGDADFFFEKQRHCGRYFKYLLDRKKKIIAVAFNRNFATKWICNVYLEYIEDENRPYMQVTSHFLKYRYYVTLESGQKIVVEFNYWGTHYRLLDDNKEEFANMKMPFFSLWHVCDLNINNEKYQIIAILVIMTILKTSYTGVFRLAWGVFRR